MDERIHDRDPLQSSLAGNVADSSENEARATDGWLFVAMVPLLPGLFFGVLSMVLTPVMLLQGRGTWFIAYPLTYTLLQVSALAARWRTSRHFGRVSFNAWSLCAILSSMAMIAELQRQIAAFHGPCGNALLGPILIQFACCGTMLGIALLVFIDWLGRKH
jgi:hypothetical protein